MWPGVASASPTIGCFRSKARVTLGFERVQPGPDLVCLYRTVTSSLIKKPVRRAFLLWVPERGGGWSALPAGAGFPGSAPGCWCWEGGRSCDSCDNRLCHPGHPAPATSVLASAGSCCPSHSRGQSRPRCPWAPQPRSALARAWPCRTSRGDACLRIRGNIGEHCRPSTTGFVKSPAPPGKFPGPGRQRQEGCLLGVTLEGTPH